MDETGGSMPLNIRWIDGLTVGHPEIDAEHRRFVELLGQLNAILPDSARWEEALALTIEITDTTLVHFAHEEMILRDYGFPDADGHAAEHRRLSRVISDLCAATMRSATYEMRASHLRVLTKALFDHLARCDMTFKSFLMNAINDECVRRQGPRNSVGFSRE